MLIVSRKAKETIRIGPDVRVTVVAVRGNRVKVAIEAPGWLEIVRAELDERPRPPAARPPEMARTG